jgi:pimeloyl-ACP methyl ester carboxylesterase
MVLGLVFLSPAAYPWDGSIEWYYRVASTPVLGQMFSTLVAPPVGLFAIDRATREVFAPNARPDNYVKEARALQAVRPAAFRHNAREIAALNAWAKKASPAYRNIDAPTIIITGDTDEIVSPEIHSRQLARDISNSKLIIVRGLGHKSDYVARDLAVASIEKLAGKKVNLVSIAKSLERSLAADAN